MKYYEKQEELFFVENGEVQGEFTASSSTIKENLMRILVHPKENVFLWEAR